MFSSFFSPPLQRHGSSQPPPRNFGVPLKAYPGSMSGKQEIENGNKVLLPASVLHQLSQFRLPNPLLFTIQNTIFGNSTNVGVLEFTAEEGNCYVPSWLFDVLNLDFGMEVNLMLVASVPRGKFVKIQPHQTAFIDLPDPRAVLEKNLARYTCLTRGETICIKVADQSFMLDILEIKPDNPIGCICVIEADVEVDFAPPLDYKEPEPNLIKQPSNLQLNDHEEEEPQGPFQGKGIKLNGQVVATDPNQKKKVSNDEYDPRKHRLPNGVRQTIIKDEFKDLKVGLVIGKTSIQKVISGSTKGPAPKETGSPVPLLKKHSSIAGSTGHSHSIHEEPHIKPINSGINRTGSIQKPNESISKGVTAANTQASTQSTIKPTTNTTTATTTTTTSKGSTNPTGLTSTQPSSLPQSKPSYTGNSSTSYTSSTMGISKGPTAQPTTTQTSKASTSQTSSYTSTTSTSTTKPGTNTSALPTRTSTTTTTTTTTSNKPGTTTTSSTTKPSSSNLSYTNASKK